MRVSGILLAVLIAGAGAAGKAQRGSIEPACPGPNTAVRVTAQQLSDKPPAYAFLVTNLHNSPLRSVIIGQGTDAGLIGAAFNVPKAMEAAPGWRIRQVNVEETPYMYFLLEADDQAARTPPQKSVAGFRITLPPMTDRTLQQFNGKKVDQVSFEGVPFKAAFSDGSCRWGIVGLDKLPK